jgi:predicted N-acetyltransferase YhbS
MATISIEEVLVRQVTNDDYRSTEEVIRESFWNKYAPGADEHYLQHMIRQSTDNISELDYVAEIEGKIVGSITYTRSKIVSAKDESQDLFTDIATFGPIGVLPEYGKRGIASKLILQTLQIAKAMGFRAVIIFGDPRFYCRLGFRCGEKYDITDECGKFCCSLLVYPLDDDLKHPFGKDFEGGKFVESAVFSDESLANEEELSRFDSSFPSREKGHDVAQDVFHVLRSLNFKHDQEKFPRV